MAPEPHASIRLDGPHFVGHIPTNFHVASYQCLSCEQRELFGAPSVVRGHSGHDVTKALFELEFSITKQQFSLAYSMVLTADY